MFQSLGRLIGLLAMIWLAAACAAPAAPPAPAPTAPAAASVPTAAAPAPTAPSRTPTSGPAAPAALSPAVRVRVGTVPSTGMAPIYIALDRGYFTQLGLEVDNVEFDAVTRMMQPLAAGQLDAVAAALSAGMFNAAAREIDMRIVADRGADVAGYGETAVVVRRDLWDGGEVRALEDLRGRRVGVPGFQAGSAVTAELGHALETRGMSLDQLDIVDAPFSETMAGLANRSLDAGFSIEPLITIGVNNGTFSVLLRSSELYPDMQQGFMLYSADFARNQTEAARRWMVAYLRGVRDYADAFVKGQGRDEVIDILIRNTSVKDPAIYRQMTPPYINPNGRVNAAKLAEAQDWFAAHGYVPQKADMAALIDMQFVDYALQTLGEYRQ